MIVVSILAQKGGVGKSMLARSLAVQGLLDGRKTALIDADPQGTVTAWGKRRQLDVPAVVAWSQYPGHRVGRTAEESAPIWWSSIHRHTPSLS